MKKYWKKLALKKSAFKVKLQYHLYREELIYKPSKSRMSAKEEVYWSLPITNEVASWSFKLVCVGVLDSYT